MTTLADPPHADAVFLNTDPMPREPFTEYGHARRIVAAFGGRLRYIPLWKKWMLWTGTHWSEDITGAAPRCAKAVARALLRGAADIDDDQTRKAVLQAARKFETSRGIRGALDLAGTEPGIALTPAQLDQDPWMLNVANGTLDLRNGELRPHDPQLHLTKLAGAAYRPDAPAPGFGRFLARVQPDPVMRAYLARLLGQALVGQVDEHLLPVFTGNGANGKSTLLETVQAALGDYAAPGDPALLVDRGWDAHPTGVADLHGRRLVVIQETDKGRALAEGTVKRLTGGDQIKARRMREDFWSFIPSHQLILVTNHRPEVRGDDEGIWRRLRIVPWPIRIPDSERDAALGERLRATELDGVLTWLARGLVDWRNQGLADPGDVVDATAAYRADSDAVGRFLDEKCVIGAECWALSRDLWAAWEAWCRETESAAGRPADFGQSLRSRGMTAGKGTAGVRKWSGLALARADDAGPNGALPL